MIFLIIFRSKELSSPEHTGIKLFHNYSMQFHSKKITPKVLHPAFLASSIQV